MRRWTVPALCVATLAFLGWVLVAADRGRLPWFIRMLYEFRGGDKVGHVLLMGLVVFCIDWAAVTYRSSGARRGHRVALASGLFAAALTLEEASQHYVSHRTMSVLDLLCSYAGIALAGSVWIFLLASRKDRSLARRRGA